MTLFSKVEYTLKAGVGGAGVGLALCGFVSFFPVALTTASVATVTILTSIALSVYTFTNIE